MRGGGGGRVVGSLRASGLEVQVQSESLDRA